MVVWQNDLASMNVEHVLGETLPSLVSASPTAMITLFSRIVAYHHQRTAPQTTMPAQTQPISQHDSLMTVFAV